MKSVQMTEATSLTISVISLLISVASLSGAHLAPKLSLATLPVVAMVLGTLLMIYPASMLMGRLGRRGGFIFKAGVGIIGGIVCCLALYIHNFMGLMLGTFLLGIFASFGQYYRFAAIEAVHSVSEQTSAVAVVTGAGVAGGVVGPFLGGQFADAWAGVPYAGAFVALLLLCVLLAFSQLLLSPNLGSTTSSSEGGDEKSFTLKLHGDFARATFLCAIGFAVMTLVMNAAPLSMHAHGFDVHASSQVLQVHFVMMYLPSFIIPLIAKHLGLRGLMTMGVAVGAMGCLLTIFRQQTHALFMFELACSGIAWSFIFNGGTLLLSNTYPATLKTKAQGINSLVVYSANIIASFSAGPVMAYCGWLTINIICLPALVLALWLLWVRKRSSIKC